MSMTPEIKTYTEFDDYYTDAGASVRSRHPDFHVLKLNQLGNKVKSEMGPFKTAYYQFAIGNAAKADLSIYNEPRVTDNYSLIVYLPGQIIRWRKTGNWEGYVLNVKESFLQSGVFTDTGSSPFLHRLDPLVEGISERDYHSLAVLFEMILEEQAFLGNDSLQVCRHLMHVLIVYINRMLVSAQRGSGERPASEQPDLRSRDIASRFKGEVMRHYREQKSVAFYARELGVSPAYLGEAVKQVYNVSPKHMINEVVYLHARTMLETSDMGIKELADSLNFDDYSHFVKFFKKMSGSTPAAWRKSSSGQT